jgi:hypothetical protein
VDSWLDYLSTVGSSPHLGLKLRLFSQRRKTKAVHTDSIVKEQKSAPEPQGTALRQDTLYGMNGTTMLLYL